MSWSKKVLQRQVRGLSAIFRDQILFKEKRLKGPVPDAYFTLEEERAAMVRETDGYCAQGSSEDSVVAPNLHPGPSTESVGAHHGVLASEVSVELSASQPPGASPTSACSGVLLPPLPEVLRPLLVPGEML